MNAAIQKEALRQQMLLRALWSERGAPLALQGWLNPASSTTQQGLAAYRANAAALAERALAAAYPTIAALVGDESFAAMARGFWHRQPPERGDVAEWGAGLPDFIAEQASLADEPYLADSARLDWAVHHAARAGDADAAAIDVDRLANTDPAHIAVHLAPGTALLHSAWPIAAIWQAHRRNDAGRFDAVRQAFAERCAQQALVVREGFTVAVHALEAADAAFMRAVLAGGCLADALDAAGDRFAFDHWLVRALQARWLQSLAFDAD